MLARTWDLGVEAERPPGEVLLFYDNGWDLVAVSYITSPKPTYRINVSLMSVPLETIKS